MTGSALSFLKTLIKSSLDNYVLPGTLTGTEIMLLYLSHWKRNFEAIVAGAIHLVQMELALLRVEESSVDTEALSECPSECADSRETV